MHVIAVEITVRREHVAAFQEALLKNAKQSRETEPGCRQFDVCVDPKDPTRYFLYERYDDEAAFKAHLETAHYHAFSRASKPWIESVSLRALTQVAP